MDIYDYGKYPAKEDWEKICKDKIESINKIGLERTKNKFTFNLLDYNEGYYGIRFNYWLQEFNNRAFDLVANYTLLKSYYDAGIPDDEWYTSGEDGTGVRYFPHFEERHHGNLYWFGFYLESYYTRFEGLIDAIYHVINIKYKFDIEPALRFRKKVLKELETTDKDLYDYLSALPQDAIYKKVSEYRNNMVHNYRPSQIDSGYIEQTHVNGIKTIDKTVGNYTTSTEFLTNINDSLDLLAEIIDEIKDKVTEDDE
ncbi:Cthe_2314 family HEPN domain-containing protein [Priestia megaterium]|uniref:Cthe_2314 family HEPN domain-containing protein n=1 Tax=Priestia megaterium TaxID=1404 RepID=UPI0030008973